MIFLKKFKANGFKSYAEDIELVFDKPLIGIVGPNGAGKSNVVDALKWVLGERSMKQLRGKSGDDVIFFGSKDRPASKFAEVTLVFDNSAKKLHDKRKELTITRKVHRGSGISEYFINNEPATLKNITDIFLDTGLARGSLGIISQGTVSWFVEAKPEDRRKIFEEAAGIGRYSKKKEDAFRQLDRTADNLKQVTVIVNELSRDLKKLTVQADKAKSYKEAHEELKELDLIISVRDYLRNKNEFDKANKTIQEITLNFEKLEPELKDSEEKLEIAKERFETADKNIAIIQEELQNLYSEISQLEQRKIIIDVHLKNDLASKNSDTKSKALKQLIKTSEAELNQYSKTIKKIDDDLNNLLNEFNKKNETIAKDRETHLSLSESYYKITAELDFLAYQKEMDLEREIGVKTVLNNKAALSGIIGIVQDFIDVDKEYEKAISVALGRAANNIIVNTNNDAKKAVEFLKNNKSGLATFLPIENIKPRTVKEDHYEILNQLEGFLGTADALVNTKDEFKTVIQYLMGQILVAQDLDAAFKISRFTYQLYRVITLDGNIVAAGGAVTGGFRNNRPTFFNVEGKIKKLEEEKNNANTNLKNLGFKIDKMVLEISDLENQINERKVSFQRYNDLINSLQKQISEYKIEYEQLTNKTYDGKNVSWNENKIYLTLNELMIKKESLNEDLRLNQETKNMYRTQIDSLSEKLHEVRKVLDEDKSKLVNFNETSIRNENVMDNIKNKINEYYKIAIEYAIENYQKELPVPENQARIRIAKLQSQLDNLGPVNIDAISELDDKQKRFDELSKQQQELLTAKEQIQMAIDELDNKARIDFKNLIDQLNEELPKTFYYLFGGGSCQIRYTDPEEDVLTTGIEVYANPPGKNVGNLMLLSGGEKTLVALSVLFSILKISAFPLVILDEAESALDPANVERFANIIRQSCDKTQFLVITHRQGTMTKCDRLLGATMQTKGVTKMLSVTLEQAENYVSENASESQQV
ncbi:AAA family ATPase [Mycoplasmoides pirum]|uniref:AAA family ATPase n=1 Tax=Mycoplasmoides pirum TaxID=2122 RepID=UPI000489CA86|nr:AAA family ATPase [Mycoplasmoides pirum]